MVDHYDGKASRLDLRARLTDGTEIDIEIQVSNMKAYVERILYYWSKMYSGDLERGNSYESLNKCIVINILDFELFKHDKMHAVFHIAEDELGSCLTDHLEFHFIELPKLKVYNKNKGNECDLLIEWSEFLNIQDESELMAMSNKELPEEIRKAFEELKELSKDPAMREIALNREIALRDYYQRLFEAEQKGREEGIRLANLNLAKKMKEQGFSNEQIQNLVGIELSEIEALE